MSSPKPKLPPRRKRRKNKPAPSHSYNGPLPSTPPAPPLPSHPAPALPSHPAPALPSYPAPALPSHPPSIPSRSGEYYKRITDRAKRQQGRTLIQEAKENAQRRLPRRVSVQELKDRLHQSRAPPRKNPPKFAPVAMINNLNRNYVADDLENLKYNKQMNAVLGSPILFSEEEWVNKYFGGRRKTRRKLKRKKRKTRKSKNKRKTRRRKGRKNKRKSRRRRR